MLFKSSNTLRLYAQISSDVDMNSIQSTLVFVEEKHIKNIIGKELYATLNDAYAVALSDDELAPLPLKKLLEQCRKVIGPMLCYYFAPKADVQLSDSGLQRVESDTNKTAYQYQNTAFAQANLREGEACTESLMSFLEENISKYPEWANSAAFKKFKSLFIKTGSEFDDLYTSQTPYRNYYAVRTKMFDVEENNIRDLLGDVMFEELKSIDADTSKSFSAQQLRLMVMIKKTIAYLTIAFAIPTLNVRIDAAGLSVMALANYSSSDKENTRGGADDNARVELIKSCQASADIWIISIVKFLKKNKTDFSTWKGFDIAVPIVYTPSVNGDLSSTFGLI